MTCLTNTIHLTDEEEDDPDNYGLGFPDYDITERLKEINDQWDKEPLPDDSRHRLIEFKKVCRKSDCCIKVIFARNV